MGYKSDGKYGYWMSRGQFTKYYQPVDLEYHTSWDWLMEVVDKIKDIVSKAGQNGYVESYYEKPWGSEVKIWGRDILEPVIRYKSTESLLDAYWNACVQFITWYNTQQH